MRRLIAQRLTLAIPTMLVVATLTFFMVKLVPGNPASRLVGVGATQQEIAVIDSRLGLDKPVLTQYVDWLGKAVHGNLGESYVTHQTVTSALSTSVPATMSLAVLATLLAFLLGTGLGMFAALREGVADKCAQAAASLGLGVPNFWLAFLLIYLFAIKLSVFPATGYTPWGTSVGQWILGLVLPVVAIAVNNTAQIMFQARSATLDVLSSDFVRTLQAVGLSRRRIIFKHVLRNAAIPVVTVTGFVFVVSLGGVVVIEQIFAIGGMGSLFLNAVNQDDLPIVQGAILYFTVAAILVNLLVDLSVGWIDPRARRS